MADMRDWMRRTAAVLGAYAAIGGAISLAGWAADVPQFANWDGSGIAIQPNATVAALAAGTAVVLLSRGYAWLAGLVGAFVCLIGASVIFQNLTGLDLGIDTVFMFERTWGRVGVLYPGRMGPPGAISWTLLGAALVLAAFPRARPLVPGLALTTTAISGLSLVGYLYGANVLFTIPTRTIIALQTATFILAVSVGFMLTVPEHGPMRLLADEGPAGVLTRRILPALIAVPLFLGVLRIAGDRAGLYDAAFGTAMRTIAEIALLFALLWWTGDAISTQSARRRESERLFRATLEEADRRKTEFLATLAHELRNPLAPIRTAAELLKHPHLSESDQDRARGIITRQVRLMSRLLDDLLDVSRITSDKLELRTEHVDLRPVVEGAVEMCEPLIKEFSHELTVTLPPEPLYVEADPARLGQVFGNLLNNACRYTDPGGQIAIMVDREPADAVIRIRDNGIGIPPEQRSTIFEMFSQVDRSHDGAQQGLGIGLHLVKRLVDMHHGRVEISTNGAARGTEFIVHLPRLADPPFASVAAAKPRAAVRPPRVRADTPE